MNTVSRKLRPREIVQRLIDSFLANGVDLKSVTLEEFKTRFREVARRSWH